MSPDIIDNSSVFQECLKGLVDVAVFRIAVALILECASKYGPSESERCIDNFFWEILRGC